MEQNSLFNVLLARGMTSGEAADIEEKLRHKADLDDNGLVPVSQLPPVVFERMKVVADDTARFALTIEDVQNGDVVYVNATQIMYYVIDDTKLDEEAGYKPLAAGIAAKAIADQNGTNIADFFAHFTFSANSGHYYLQPEQPTNPSDGDIWIG